MNYLSAQTLGTAAILAALAVSGCTPYVASTTEQSAAAGEERCRVTGSNMPSRNCRADVTILPPSVLDNRVPGGQPAGPGQR